MKLNKAAYKLNNGLRHYLLELSVNLLKDKFFL